MFKFIGGAVVTIAILAFIGSRMDPTPNPTTASIGGSRSSASCDVTMEEFNKLRTGMSVSQVERIIGCPGTEISRNSLSIPSFENGKVYEDSVTTVMYQWDGNATLSGMNAMFQNNAMVQKSQMGLR